MLEIKFNLTMKLRWSCIFITDNLSEGLSESETTHVTREKIKNLVCKESISLEMHKIR